MTLHDKNQECKLKISIRIFFQINKRSEDLITHVESVEQVQSEMSS
jgi:hypothetical protein